MSQRVLMGIDLGTTALKVCAFDARNGRLLGQAIRRLTVRIYPGGGREQDCASVDRAFGSAARELRERLGGAWRHLAGIGLAAQGGSSIIADRTSGKALTPMVLWNDRRAQAHLDEIASLTRPAYWRRHVLSDHAPHGLGRLVWLQETQPRLFNAENIHVGAGEYLLFKLTGVWRQDAGNAIQAGSYNAAKKRLDRHPFAKSGLPLSFVAPLRRGHETAPLSRRGARRLGLAEGLPVAGPYIDQEAGYLSAVGVSSSPLQCSLGTAWVGNFLLPDDTAGWSPCQLVIPSPVAEGRLVILPLLAGNLTWDWALATCVDADHPAAIERAGAVFRRSLLPPEGLVALPWFTQANPLNAGAHGAGAIFGLSAQTTSEDMLRAVAAGMAYEFARVFAALKDSGRVDSLVLGGGASRGWFFRSLIAGLFAPLPVLWQRDGDLAAARGALFAFSQRAARANTRAVPMPDRATRARIDTGFRTYCETLEKLFASPPGGEAFRFGNPQRRRP